MRWVVATAVGTLFGVGVGLMLKRDLLFVVAGSSLVANAGILLLVFGGLLPGDVAPLALDGGEVPANAADPLVQAMALTAIVIDLSFTAFLWALVRALQGSTGLIDEVELAKRDLDPAEQERAP